MQTENYHLQKNTIQMNLLKLLNKHKTFLLLYALFTTLANAQNTGEPTKLTFADYKKSYPDFNELILNETQHYDFSIVKNKLQVLQDNYQESIILSELGIHNNEESFSYSELVKILNYDAYSVTNTNGKEKKIKVTQTNERQSRSNSVFFDDVKERQLIFPNLEIGSKKVYQYQTEFVDPFLLHKFIFGNTMPVKNAMLEITTDKDIEIGYKIFNDPKNLIAFTKTEKKGKNVYRWVAKDMRPLKFENNNPGFLHIVPHINVYIKNYKIDDTEITVLDDTKKLYSYYQGFVKDLNKNEDADLKALTAEIIAGKTSEIEKLKSIFYWVKDNIKYIAFENGYEGFIPREASVVFQRKFGDCKDMASIIVSMAKYAGINDVNITWIGTRNIPYSYADLSTPAVDDHMIATYKNGEQYIFLDATDKQTRFGIPTAFIQDKEAMINDKGGYKIVKVPVVRAEDNASVDMVNLKLEGTKLVGTGEVAYTGHTRSHYLMQIGDVKGKTRMEMIKSMILKGNNKFNLVNFTEENVDDRDKPYVIKYQFNLDNYVVTADKEMYVNLFLEKFFEKHIIEKDRVAKYEFDFLTSQHTRYSMEIPANYTLKFTPKNYSEENDLMKCDIKYEVKGNVLTLDVLVNLKKMLLDYPDFEKWNETIKKLKSNYSETIILTQK
jgi:transglutaminase-like putative cysteine protease